MKVSALAGKSMKMIISYILTVSPYGFLQIMNMDGIAIISAE